MIFELVVVDTREQADAYPIIKSDNHVQRAVFIGEALCGVRYGAMRPNKLTLKCREMETDLEREWYDKILIKAVVGE